MIWSLTRMAATGRGAGHWRATADFAARGGRAWAVAGIHLGVVGDLLIRSAVDVSSPTAPSL